ncbi:hypothetical protein KJ359_005150 [Pestalotiopsis sp. 9143b]|nr:hypothetical protein KJ359_005150 [Pestalotiopsis sp. 9143b]
MPELPTVQRGEWVAENYDALLAAIGRDDVHAITGYKAIGLEVQTVVPDTGPDSAQQAAFPEIEGLFKKYWAKKGSNTTRDKTASKNSRVGERKEDDDSKKGNNVTWDKETRENSLIGEGKEDDDSRARAKFLADYIMSTTDIYD